ncbi:hypothetical protein M493_10360 [Geobacillus genomosp. 3]|uniref:YqcI/YcgG family protein n=1 Tax=Geobacillus genomosp. 3 TaxID=1921421 RepID=S5ZPG3_GEOG3|nr:YqcI/YcgG family protein [Geobacillus genomosp. 3]AGT32333.1 hypothetical protein M493_10360 [Geobacillus genomosp. 3]
MVQLFSRQANQEHWLPWQREAMSAFAAKMADRSRLFPCIPAVQAYALDDLRYGFASDPRSETAAQELAALLAEFAETSRQIGNDAALVVFFDTPAELADGYTVAQFEELFWQLLRQTSALDVRGWLDVVPLDPNDPLWEFCFHRERFFMYCATPAHRKRQSRHFPWFMLAATPRWVLEQFYAEPVKAEKIKQRIRERLGRYDTAPVHPDLNSYGNPDNYEWKQYFLRDDETSLPACPFQRASSSNPP